MALTDTAIRKAVPGAKPRKLTDGRGLFLLLQPNGSRWWRFRYRVDGKEKLLSLGTYPDVGLQEARSRRDEARQELAAGIDPSAKRKAEKVARADDAANTFEAIAREWFAQFSPSWAKSHAGKVIRRIERDLLPWIGTQPISMITAPELLRCLRRIEERGALETAHRALQNTSQVFRFAVATGRAERDPSVDLRGALAPWRPEHYPTVLDPAQIGGLLRKIDAYSGRLVVRSALKLAPLVFVRPGELRTARWADMDLESGEWRYIVSKTNTPHIVPLSSQALEILRELHPLTGHGEYVFPGARSPRSPMSDNAMLQALRRMGIDSKTMTIHGWRAMARTLLDENLSFRPDYIEHQLAHAVRDPNGRAYNRTAHLAERRKMMQAWADYLDQLRNEDSKVVPLQRTA